MGEIVELMQVCFDKNNADIVGDVKVHEYGNAATSSFKGAQYPLYTNGSKTCTRPIKPGQSSRQLQPLTQVVWTESFVMWGDESKMLAPKSRKVLRTAMSQILSN